MMNDEYRYHFDTVSTHQGASSVASIIYFSVGLGVPRGALRGLYTRRWGE
jgi:hypothetical protein